MHSKEFLEEKVRKGEHAADQRILQILIDMHGNGDRQGIIETLEALYTGPRFHHPDCNYWQWDWRYSWDDSDCNCDKVAGPKEQKDE